MNKFAVLIVIAAFLTTASASCKKNVIGLGEEPTPTPVVKTGWTLYWSDEFNDTALDTSVWTAEDIKWPYSGEEEYYTPREENLKLESGNLVITALKESYSGAEYTSGRINTKTKIESAYGYIEARMKMPYGKGMWPAFWLLMEPSVYPTYYGEIDVMEMVGGGSGKDNMLYGTCHWGETGIVSDGGNTSLVWPAKLSDDFHVYAVEWDATSMKWYFDGSLYHTADITGTEQTELHQNQYVIFNIAVGGTWPGSPDLTTVWPQKMYVDWVRWWKK